MRATEFLMEAGKPAKKQSKGKRVDILPEKVIATLYKECDDYIHWMKKPLYRGVNVDSNSILVKGKISTNRMPKDSSNIDTAAFNYVFEKNTGIANIRNITSYVTTREDVASSYGDTQLVFPTNGTQYIRAVGIKDLYSDIFQSELGYGYGLMNRWLAKIKVSSKDEDKFDKLFSEGEQKMEAMDDIKGGMIKAAQVDKMFPKPFDKLWEMFVEPLNKVIKKYFIYDGYHPELSKAKEEIMIFGKPYFYMINLERIDSMLYDAKDAGHRIFIGDKELNVMKLETSQLVATAIKENKPIYYLEVDEDEELDRLAGGGGSGQEFSLAAQRYDLTTNEINLATKAFTKLTGATHPTSVAVIRSLLENPNSFRTFMVSQSLSKQDQSMATAALKKLKFSFKFKQPAEDSNESHTVSISRINTAKIVDTARAAIMLTGIIDSNESNIRYWLKDVAWLGQTKTFTTNANLQLINDMAAAIKKYGFALKVEK